MQRTTYFTAFLTASLLILSGCSGADAPETETTAELSAVPLTVGDVTRVVNASGKIVPRDEVMVGSEVSGRILEVAVDFNSRVQAGDLLARIDPESFRNRVRQLNGRLQSAQADIKVREASINRANVNLSQALTVLERQQELFAQNAVSQARLDEAERSVGVSRADLELSMAQLESSKAQVSQIEAEIATARLDLQRTTILSPIDGVIIDRKVDPGQTVQASFSAPELFALAADLSDIRVEAQIVESDVAGLESGDMVKFSVDAYPDLSLTGEVEQLRLKSQEENNIVTYVAVVAAKNDSGKLMPGMTANLEITTDIKSGVNRIPAQAERFRPTPDQVAQWQAESESNKPTEKPSLNAPAFARLARIGLSQDKLSEVEEALNTASKPLRDIINDPEKPFLHTPMKIRLSELTDNILETQLSPVDYSAYKALIAAERNIREVTLWLKTPDGKMRQQAVKLGLSDGAYIEVIDGLSEGDQIVTGIRVPGQGGGRPRGGRPRG